MQDPVFVDTSDGKTLIADSLKNDKPSEETKQVHQSSEKIKKQNVVMNKEEFVNENDSKKEQTGYMLLVKRLCT